MSAKIMGKVYDLDLPQNEQSVLLALADHADHEGDNIFPSNGLVAWKIGASDDTVSRLKKKLEDRGILVCVMAAPGHVKKYRIDFSRAILKQAYDPKRTGNMTPTPPQVAATTKANPPANIGSTPPQMPVNPPAQLCGPNHVEPSKEPSAMPAPGAGAGGVKARSVAQGAAWKMKLLGDGIKGRWISAYAHRFPGSNYQFTGADHGQLKSFIRTTTLTPQEFMDVAIKAWNFKPKATFSHCRNAISLSYVCRFFNEIKSESENENSSSNRSSNNSGTLNQGKFGSGQYARVGQMVRPADVQRSAD